MKKKLKLNLHDHAIERAPALIKKARKELRLRKMLPTPKWTLEVGWVSRPTMKRLNHRYRGKNQPTDVLSFPAPEIFRQHGMLGELILCEPVLRKQAKEIGHSPEDELEVLLIHGLLHLLGFDHEEGKAAARAMASWEAKLLGKNSGLIGRHLSSRVGT